MTCSYVTLFYFHMLRLQVEFNQSHMKMWNSHVKNTSVTFYCAMRCLDMWKKPIASEFMYVILFSQVKQLVSMKKQCHVWNFHKGFKAFVFNQAWKTCILFTESWINRALLGPSSSFLPQTSKLFSTSISEPPVCVYRTKVHSGNTAGLDLNGHNIAQKYVIFSVVWDY